MTPEADVRHTYDGNIEAVLGVLGTTRRGRRIVRLLRKHKVRFVYTRLVPLGAGLTLGRAIFLNPEMRDPTLIVQPDKAALVAHEATHFQQWLRQRRSRLGSLANERMGNAVERMVRCELLGQDTPAQLTDDLRELVSSGREAAYGWLKRYWRGYGTFPERQPTYRQWRQWLPQLLFIATGERIEVHPPMRLRVALRSLRRRISVPFLS
jgi:hypothetical protein